MFDASLPLALLAFDRPPSSVLADTLLLCGYRLDVAYGVDAAVRSLNHRIPDLVVAGPFRHATGLAPLLRKLHELGVAVVVVSAEPDIVGLAMRLGMLVRSYVTERDAELPGEAEPGLHLGHRHE